MPMVVLTTNADPRRPYLTYKIEFEDQERLLEWLDAKWLLEELHLQWNETDRGGNTSLTVFHGSGKIEHRTLKFRWDQVAVVLETADDISKNWSGAPGRPARRVLQATTSKERRSGSKTAY